MDEKKQQENFYNDLERLISRYYDEYDMSYESIVGVLTRRVVSTILEDIESEDSEEEELQSFRTSMCYRYTFYTICAASQCGEQS